MTIVKYIVCYFEIWCNINNCNNTICENCISLCYNCEYNICNEISAVQAILKHEKLKYQGKKGEKIKEFSGEILENNLNFLTTN